MKRAKGLKVEDIRVGHGRAVEPKDVVIVHYVCTRPKGDVVYDTRGGMPYQFQVGERDCYVGLEQGVIGMKQGGLRKVKVPPQLTYLERERRPALPENALLYYEIELLKISTNWDNTLHLRDGAESCRTNICKHLHYFRPGEESRMLARCQFCMNMNGACSVVMTYPIKGYPWRRNIHRYHHFSLDEETTTILFSEVFRIRRDSPEECLSNDQTWNDPSEKGNGITRDRKSNRLCYTIGVFGEGWNDQEEYFAIRENSEALINSELYKTISALIAPYEKLQ